MPRLKELPMQPFGPDELIASLGPHPIEVSIHG
jgi:hypothetical protein